MKEKKYSPSKRKEKLFMSVNDIETLHDNGHTIGLHSHSHPTQIHNLDYESQLEEYTKNYEFISSIILYYRFNIFNNKLNKNL